MNYSKIIQHDCANGEGWRTTLFVSGCTNHCNGCFNKELQDFNCGEQFTMLTIKSILDMVSDDKIKGLSILGGDPLCQDVNGLHKLTEVCKRVHHKNKDVWLWSGFTWEQVFPEVVLDELNTHKIYQQKLIENVDVFVDGPFIEELKDPSLKWRGSSNQRIINVKQTLQQNKIILYEGENKNGRNENF